MQIFTNKLKIIIKIVLTIFIITIGLFLLKAQEQKTEEDNVKFCVEQAIKAKSILVLILCFYTILMKDGELFQPLHIIIRINNKNKLS